MDGLRQLAAERFGAGQVADAGDFDDGVRGESGLLVSLERCHGRRLVVGGVETMPARVFEPEIEAARAREQANEIQPRVVFAHGGRT